MTHPSTVAPRHGSADPFRALAVAQANKILLEDKPEYADLQWARRVLEAVNSQLKRKR